MDRRALPGLAASLAAMVLATVSATWSQPYLALAAAACALLAYDIGEPIKRQQILIGQAHSMEEVGKKLAESPALREELAKMLKDAEAMAGQSAG